MSTIAHLPTKLRTARMIFLICGLITSTWAPLVPYVKSNLHLDESQLGLLFLAMGLGAITMMPIAGRMISWVGCKPLIGIGTVAALLILPFLVLISDYNLMVAALFAFGLSIGLMDVSMNTHGLLVQKAWGKQVVSSMHGLYSAGGIFGALVFSICMQFIHDAFWSAFCIVTVLVLFGLAQFPNLLTRAQEQSIQIETKETATDTIRTKKFPLSVCVLGLMCCAAFISEGAMLDWSSVFLHEFRGLTTEWASLGFVAFSIAMTLMRMVGDRLIQRFSSTQVVVAGSVVAALGIVVLLLTPWAVTGIVGFVLLGLGAANTVPMLFQEASQTPGMSAASGIAAVSTMGYGGQLIGPVFLGFIAHHFTLSHAFALIGILFLFVAFLYPMRKMRWRK